MKIKVSQETINKILENPDEAKKAGIKMNDPWWVILLKVIAYAIGLILGGTLTVSCANIVGIV